MDAQSPDSSLTPPPSKPSPGRRFLRLLAGLVSVAFVAAVTAGGIAALHWRAQSAPTVAQPLPQPVATVTVRQQTGYSVAQRYAGRLEAARSVHLSFERGGLVTDVLMEEGDRVEAGAVAARLDTASLATEKARLVAERRRTQAQLELARLTAERQAALTDKGHSSRQRYDEARLTAEALAATLASVEAAIRAVEIEIDKSEVVAPFAGRLGERLVDEGTVVEAGAPLAELLETGRIQARIGLPPEVAGQFAAGEPHLLLANGNSLAASVVAVRPDLQPDTRTVTVLFDVAPAQNLPPLGELVALEVERRVEAPGAWLPLTALTEGVKGLWSVYRVAKDSGSERVVRESVAVLHVEHDQAFVRGTLRDGMKVVTGGLNRLTPGQAVAEAGD